MDVEAQCALIREFMVAVAPEMIVYGLSNDLSTPASVALVLEASLQLAARYNELRETLTASPKKPLKESKPQTSGSAADIHKAQARIPVTKSELPDLRGSGSGHPSPLSPAWKPPAAHE